MQEFYDEELQNGLEGYTLASLELTSAPLAETRPRIWWLGSCDADFEAATWKKAVEQIQEAATRIPRQSLFPLFEASKGVGGAPASDNAAQQYDLEAKYSQIFAEQMHKAIRAKKIPENAKPKPREERPSAVQPNLQKQAPGCKAIADVVELILTYQYDHDDMAGAPGDKVNMVADISQSSERCKISVNGVWGTLTTSSRLFDFIGGKFLDAQMHLRLLGLDPDKLNLTALKEKETQSINILNVS